MIVLGVTNQKGGVGKTTTSVSIATEFALRGYRTLLVDGDPQSNATNNFLDLGKVKLERSLYDVIVEMSGVQSIPVREAVVKTIVPELDLLPSTVRLAMFDVMPSAWLDPVSLDASRRGAEGAGGGGTCVLTRATKTLASPAEGTLIWPKAIDPE